MYATIALVLLYVSSSLADDCYFKGKSNRYSGTTAVSKSGKTCKAWITKPGPDFGLRDQYFPEGSIEHASNYCRDPDKSGKPWCFTDSKKAYEYCDIPQCDYVDCYTMGQAKTYKGHTQKAEDGSTCLHWNKFRAEDSEVHTIIKDNFPEGSVDRASNFCRAPDGEDRPWCFTSDKPIFKFCDVPECK